LRVPPDKSISHRALLLAAMAEGRSTLRGVSAALDPSTTAACLAALGARFHPFGGDGMRVDYEVISPGWASWSAPEGVLYCGNSGTAMRLLAGLLAGGPVSATLDGDASLRRRPMARIIEPLGAMGAEIQAASDAGFPPLTVAGRRPLRAVEWRSPVPSAQVKSAVLLAGLAATGTTWVRERIATRDHTERMLRARGVEVRTHEDPDGGWAVGLEGGQQVRPVDEEVPGDLSAAAFWLVAASVHPDAELALTNVGLNPTRRAPLDLLAAMGAQIEERPIGPDSSRRARRHADDGVGEPAADLVVRSAELRPIDLGPDDVARAIDEVPILALAASQARGTSRFRGAGELRHKESDRLAGIAEGLAALGVEVEVEGDDLAIHGAPGRLRGAEVSSNDDHRLAMTFAVAGLVGPEPVAIEGAAWASVSYPGFFAELERVRA
jgi:3-phosphoshikimate 1-carboxyvinyltransferase